MNIKPTPNSNCIAAMAWVYTGHADGKMVGSLFVVFRNGGQYRYDLVPVHIWAAICRSNSKGRAYNRLIKRQYPSICLYRPAKARKATKLPTVRKTAAERRAERNAQLLGFTQAA